MLGQYLGAGASTTKLLLHLNGNSTDSSGNGNNGTDTNITYSLANGKFGQGAGFNSAGTSKIITSAYSQSGGVATWIVWLKRAGNSANSSAWILGAWNNPFNILSYILNSDAKLKVQLGSNTIESPALSNNVWYNFIITRDGSTFYLYQDSKLVSSASYTAPSTGSQSLSIGSNPVNNLDCFYGSIDEVIHEESYWTPQKVKKYYTMAKGRFGIL
jgi:hypothetical protein